MRHSTQSVAAIVLAALLVTTIAAPTVAAQEDDAYFDGLVTVDRSGWFTNLDVEWLKLSTGVARTYDSWTSDPGQASEYANDTQEVFNANSGDIESYANERLDASTGTDVFAVHFHDRADNNATRYVVSTIENGSYTNIQMVSTTKRTPDYHIEADWYVSKHAADELELFVDEYASTGDDLSTAYRAKRVAQYGGGLESGLWSGNISEGS